MKRPMVSAAVTDGRLVAVPAADIHLHLEGRARSASWHARQRGDTPFDHAGLLARLAAANVPAGIERLNWLAARLPPEPPAAFMAKQLAAMTADLCLDAARHGAWLIEVRVGAAEWRRRGLRLTDVVQAMRQGVAWARRSQPIAVGIVASIVRNGDRQEIAALLADAIAAAPSGLNGIDLVQKADEGVVPARALAPMLTDAAAAGLGLTSHAGEFTGPRAVAETIEVLGIRRIGHGVRAQEDPGVVRLLRDAGAVGVCCLTANVVLGIVPSLTEHPARRYAEAGIAVTFNTDDPLVFNTTIAHEYALASQYLGFSSIDLLHCTRTAIAAAFVDPLEKRQLRCDLDRQIKTAISKNGNIGHPRASGTPRAPTGRADA